MNQAQESRLERESRVLRDGAILAGIGAIAVGSEGSLGLIGLGLATLLGAVASEGLRRLSHWEASRHQNPPVDNLET